MTRKKFLEPITRKTLMPDIVFYQSYASIYTGIVALSSYLTHFGYESEVVIEQLERRPIDTLIALQPKLIGISVMSIEHQWLINTAAKIKQFLPETTIIVGGIHGILYYHEILQDSCVDIVCHSEGEEALIKIINQVKKDEPEWEHVEGIAFRDKSGTIKVNPRAELITFSENIIFSSNIYYTKYPETIRDGFLYLMSGRGCPYQCHFCYNAKIQELFKEKGRYLRKKSVDNFMKEIKMEIRNAAKAGITIKAFRFMDDTFILNKKWLFEFLQRYQREINIPFMISATANVLDEANISEIAKSNCYLVTFGIETGNEYIRKVVLNKRLSDQDIISTGLLLDKYGVGVYATNMFCLPEETLQDAYKTIEINHKAKIKLNTSNLLLVFPDTPLATYCIQKGYLKPDYSLKDLPMSVQRKSMLNIPEKRKIMNVYWLSLCFIRYPWTFKLLKPITKISLLSYFLFPIYTLLDALLLKKILRTSLPKLALIYKNFIKGIIKTSIKTWLSVIGNLWTT